MDEQELEALLKPFGQVVSTRILRDPHGASRGVGFARYGAGAGLGGTQNNVGGGAVQAPGHPGGSRVLPPCPSHVPPTRMESTEKCEAVITHFNGKYIKTPPGVPGRPRGGADRGLR